MTVVVCNRKVMLSDSRVTVEPISHAYPAVKIVKSKSGWLCGAAGDGGDCSRFLEWAESDFAKKDEPKWFSAGDSLANGLVVKPDGIYFWTPNEPFERIVSDHWAVGSGGTAARAAIHCGKTIEEAVEISILINELTCGGPVQRIELGK